MRSLLVLGVLAAASCGGPLVGAGVPGHPEGGAALVGGLFETRETRALELLRAATAENDLAGILVLPGEVPRRTAAFDVVGRFAARAAADPLLGRPGLVVLADTTHVIARDLDPNRMFGSVVTESHAMRAASGEEDMGVVSMTADGSDVAEGWAQVGTIAAVPIRGASRRTLGMLYAAWPVISVEGWLDDLDLVLLHGEETTSSLDADDAAAVAHACAGRGTVREERLGVVLSDGREHAVSVGPLLDARSVRWALVTR